MNVTHVPHTVARIPASGLTSRRLAIAFGSQPELAVPLTSVNSLHPDPTGAQKATKSKAVLSVEAAPAPYSHWGINE